MFLFWRFYAFRWQRFFWRLSLVVCGFLVWRGFSALVWIVLRRELFGVFCFATNVFAFLFLRGLAFCDGCFCFSFIGFHVFSALCWQRFLFGG